MINAAFRQSLASFVRAQSTVAVADPYRLFIEQGGRVTICKPSMRNAKQLTLNPYSVRKTPTAGRLNQRQKFEPAFLLH